MDNNVINDVYAELDRATLEFPTWPTDPLHALAVLGEEFGELTKAMLQTVYEPHKVKPGEVRSEAIQTAAMALRLVMSLDQYSYRPAGQHQQPRFVLLPAYRLGMQTAGASGTDLPDDYEV